MEYLLGRIRWIRFDDCTGYVSKMMCSRFEIGNIRILHKHIANWLKKIGSITNMFWDKLRDFRAAFVIRSVRPFMGWGLLKQFHLFCYFHNLSELWNYTLSIKHHVYIWQVSPQFSCGGTCQICMWLKEFSMYFCRIENFVSGEINERSISNPHPCFDCIAIHAHTN